jgi:hypothetical protein
MHWPRLPDSRSGGRGSLSQQALPRIDRKFWSERYEGGFAQAPRTFVRGPSAKNSTFYRIRKGMTTSRLMPGVP